MLILLVAFSSFSSNKPWVLFLHSSHDSLRSSLIPSIRKLFLLQPSSRFTNFVWIFNAHVGSVVYINPTSSFVYISSFSRLCTFWLMFKRLWSISRWVKRRLSLSFWTSVFTEVRLSHSWWNLCFSNTWCPDIRSDTDFSCFVNIPPCLVSCSCNISLKIFVLFLW